MQGTFLGNSPQSVSGSQCGTLEPWYAIWVRSRHEKIVANSLTCKGYEMFLPMYNSLRRASGPASAQLPLLPGYVFCRFEVNRPLQILTTPGVVSIVSAGVSPLPVAEQEIAALRSVIASGLRAQPWPYLTEGQRVRIGAGPLRNLEGVLVKMKNECTLVISVTLLRRSVGVEIARELVEPVKELAWRLAPFAEDD